MITKPVIVTGCGRSGTHWLGHIMEGVLGPEAATHEPTYYASVTDVAVDARLRFKVDALRRDGHRIVHLVRDGRDVARSLHQWHSTHGRGETFAICCHQWAEAVDIMAGFPVLRLEDLLLPRDPSRQHTLPRWTEWDEATTATFWGICDRQMREMGYSEER
jgi:hypothetical protein